MCTKTEVVCVCVCDYYDQMTTLIDLKPDIKTGKTR